MRRRTRLVAGIFAMVAMTLSFAETAWASTCGPMEMGVVSPATADQVPAHDCLLGALHEGEREGSGDDERPCPFSPVGAQMCAGVASLPAHAVHGLAPSPESVSAVHFELEQHDLLLEEALFHPPRA